jgi:hypothetical protein
MNASSPAVRAPWGHAGIHHRLGRADHLGPGLEHDPLRPDDLGLRRDRQSDRARGHDHLVHPALSAITIVLIVYLFIPTIRDLEDRLPDHDQMAKLEEEPALTETGCA